MPKQRKVRMNNANFSPEELIFFKRMNPRTQEPARLAVDPLSDDSPPPRGFSPTYLVAIVGFAGILFLLTGAI